MKKLKLTVAEPCHESWEGMTPDQIGRFCAACQKSVVDFTTMSDRQMAHFFRKSAGSVCGRFYSHQLNRDVTVTEKRFSLPAHFFRYTWPAFLLLLKSCGEKEEIMGGIDIAITEKTDVITTMGFAFPEITPIDSTASAFQKPEPIECTSIVVQTKPIVTGDTTIVRANETAEEVFTDADTAFVAMDSEGPVDSLSLVETLPVESILMGAVVVSHLAEEKDQKKTKAEKHRVDKPEAAEIFIYPNPVAKGQSLQIFFREPVNGIYQVYTASGQLVQNGRLAVGKDQQFAVPVQSWAAGTYLINITGNKTKEVITRKFIVR